MAKIDFSSFNTPGNQGQSRKDSDYSVKFFSIQDGESAVVRLMVDTTNDFDIRSVHRVKMDGYDYGRNVNCINDTHNPSTCPLCAAGIKLEQKLFLRMLQYKVVNNQVEVVPVVWERSVFDKVFGAQKLVNYITDYGPLSDIVCKITRNGTGLNTTYTLSMALNILPNTKAVYRDDIYVKKTDAFGDFNVLGVSIMDKNFDELTQFIATGKFPERVKTDAPETPSYTAPTMPGVPTNIPTMTNSAIPDEVAGSTIPVANNFGATTIDTQPITATPATRTYTPTTPTNAPTTASAPWDNNGGFNRPRRY